MKISVIDGNNWFRRKAETDIFGNPLRGCYNELQSNIYDIIFLIWDGMSSLKKRRLIYPDYKVRRVPPAESFFEIQDEMKKLARLSKAVCIEVPGYEADDVIAYIVNKFKQEHEVIIDSTDVDLSQLGVRMTKTNLTIPADEVALYKTLVGDPSDNIPGLRGFGKGAWAKLEKIQKISLQRGLEQNLPGFFAEVLSKELTVEQWVLLTKFWRIVNFIEVPEELIEENTIIGQNNPEEVEKILNNYLS